ncbi:hypothetical protein CMI47_03415 [Candidatus Pacearchaeota archaeon]|nr:hypothetical protein [Candidatus Pacearchaeota archaeon]|tara:strand:+ start:791 stop:1162 length:372 start_codon:yes stop_codon:yes gene_type:complete
MEVILDSSFIVSAVRKKIDFMVDLKSLGFKILVPREVLQELKDLKRRGKTSRADREAIDIAFTILNDKKVKKMKLGGKNVDEGLIARGRDGAYVATLDRGIKREIENRVVIMSAKNSVGVERA